MEQAGENPIPRGKVYKDKAIWVGTFFGGPLAAGYIIAENFKVFGEHHNAKKTWIYTIIFTIVLFSGIFLIPNIEKIPKQIIPIIYTAIAYSLCQRLQGQKIVEHINAGGQYYKWWRALLIGIIGMIITFLPIVGIAYMSGDFTNDSLTTKTYGIMKHEIDFDKSNISEQEVDNIADGFRQTTFFDESISKYVYVEKANNNYEISISCNNSATRSSESLEPFIQLHNDMQTLFPNNKIVFKLVVDDLDNVVKRLE